MASLTDPRHEAYLQWLTTAPKERDPRTLEAFAATLDCAPRTLRDWKVRPEFRKEWDERATAIAGDPERTQRILDALYEQGIDGESPKQVQAARAWADIAGVIKPPKKASDLPVSLSTVPEADFDRMLQEAVAKQLADSK